MSTQYNGIASTITVPPATKAISSSTNATPIEVTTSTAHNLTTGDLVSIYDHATNTAANGIWEVEATGGTTLRLVGSVGVGVGGATGTVQPATDGPTYAIPADGDDIDAASVNVAHEGLGDRSAHTWGSLFLNARRPMLTLPDTDKSVYFQTDLWLVPDVTALRVYTLPSPVLLAPFAGRRVGFRFTRRAFANAQDARIFSGGVIATLVGGVGPSWVDVETNTAGTAFVATAWGGTAVV